MKVQALIVVLILGIKSFSQEDLKDTSWRKNALQNVISTNVEVQAEFPGGVNEMMKFVSSNITYPYHSKSHNIGGRTFLKFVVDEKGEISSAEILMSSGMKELDDEALRITTLMPQWKPAKLNGRNVKCYFTMPVGFIISQPYFIFDTAADENSQHAKQAVLNKDYGAALSFYSLNNNVEAIYNTGVLYYMKNKRSKAKKCFETVVATASAKSTYRKVSELFLNKNF